MTILITHQYSSYVIINYSIVDSISKEEVNCDAPIKSLMDDLLPEELGIFSF